MIELKRRQIVERVIMKWITALLCLFLCTPIKATADTETEITRWEHQLPHITKNEVSHCSKEMSVLYQSIMNSYLHTQSRLKKSSKECKKWENVRKGWHAKVHIRSQQFGYDQIMDRNIDTELIQKWIAQQNKIDSSLSHWKRIHKKKSIRMHQEKDWLNRLENCQQFLFKKFHRDFYGFRKGGKHNPDQSIQGSVDLPSYGAIKSLIKTDQKACPTWSGGHIDEYSQGWISMIDNGTISAGTWTYPRWRYAFGIGCGGPIIQYDSRRGERHCSICR